MHSQEIEILLSPEDWTRVQDSLEGGRSAAIKSRIDHSLRSLRREPNGTLCLVFSQSDGAVVTQALRLLFPEDASGTLEDARSLVELVPVPSTLQARIPAAGSRCEAYRLTAGLPGDATNRCEQRATQQLQVRHRGNQIPLDLCTQHAKLNTQRGRPLYFVVDTDLIGIGHPD
jgi:hypothetical protein